MSGAPNTLWKMKRPERIAAIARMLAAGEDPSTEELVERFNVSAATIARDRESPILQTIVRETLLAGMETTDLVLAFDAIRRAMRLEDAASAAVTARWLIDKIFPSIEDKKGGRDKAEKNIKEILGVVS